MRALFVTVLIGSFAAPLQAQSLPAGPMPVAPRPAEPARPAVGQGANGDWANVARYREANLVAASDLARSRVVFMGDSITQGWADQPFIKQNGKFVGRGISGQVAAQMLVRFRADVIALKPAVVHIMAGTNDIAENAGPETPAEIAGYIASMVDLAQANRIKVVLASVTPAKVFPWRRNLVPAPQIIALNRWIKTFAAERGAVFADYWPVLATSDGAMRPEFSHDGVHPNAAGYEAMRSVADAAIRRALARK